MSFRNSFGIYQAIERVLKASKQPMTCNDLFEFSEIKKFAQDVNKVSDYLGHMYRRSNELSQKERFIGRTPAARGAGGARWAYYWLNPSIGTPDKMVQRSVQPRLTVVDTAMLAKKSEVLANTARVLAENSATKVTEQPGGVIVIETLHHTITVAPR